MGQYPSCLSKARFSNLGFRFTSESCSELWLDWAHAFWTFQLSLRFCQRDTWIEGQWVVERSLAFLVATKLRWLLPYTPAALGVEGFQSAAMAGRAASILKTCFLGGPELITHRPSCLLISGSLPYVHSFTEPHLPFLHPANTFRSKPRVLLFLVTQEKTSVHPR